MDIEEEIAELKKRITYLEGKISYLLSKNPIQDYPKFRYVVATISIIISIIAIIYLLSNIE